MNGRAWKKWYKTKPKPCKDDIRDAKAELRWMKPVDRALKFAKKALKEMKKADPDSECGLWYDVSDGFGYREMCRAGGRCEARCKGRECPYALATALIRELEGD
jgi:hypothetical protein